MSEKSTKTTKKGKKRANGEGTFYQLEDKTWVHQVTLGRKSDGSPDRKTFTAKTRGVCIERREAYKEEKARMELQEQEEYALRMAKLAEAEEKGHSIESEILFSEAFPDWLRLYKSPPTKKATTYTGYLNTYNVHFEEFFGSYMLCDITQDVVQQYYCEKQLCGAKKNGEIDGLSPKTIQNHHMLLKDFFTYAVKKYHLPENPAIGTERPRVHIPKMRVLDPDELVIFLQEVIRETQRVAIIFDLFTGLRLGELLALEIADVDPKTQTVEVLRNLARVSTDAIDVNNPSIKIINYNPEKKTHIIVQEFPKTETSSRSMPISDDLFELLVRHVFFLEQSNWPNPGNLLFPSTKGTYIDPKSYAIRLSAISKRCEIKNVNPHALRHTFASRLVEQKVPLTTVMELMGHASVTTTQRYVEVLKEEKRKAIEGLTGYLNPASLLSPKRLNGAKDRMKFEDVRLPSWLQIGPEMAQA